MDFESLVKEVKAHKKQCFHKSMCDICKPVNPHHLDICDYCGVLDDDNMLGYLLYCKCDKQVRLYICEECYDNPEGYVIDVLPSVSNDFEGIYTNDCCSVTKGIK